MGPRTIIPLIFGIFGVLITVYGWFVVWTPTYFISGIAIILITSITSSFFPDRSGFHSKYLKPVRKSLDLQKHVKSAYPYLCDNATKKAADQRANAMNESIDLDNTRLIEKANEEYDQGMEEYNKKVKIERTKWEKEKKKKK